MKDYAVIVFTVEGKNEKGRPGKSDRIDLWKRRKSPQYLWGNNFVRGQAFVVDKD